MSKESQQTRNDEDEESEETGEYVGCKEVAEDIAGKVSCVLFLAVIVWRLLA